MKPYHDSRNGLSAETSKNETGDSKSYNVTGLTPRVVIILIVLTIFATTIALGRPDSGVGYLIGIDESVLPSNLGVFVLVGLGLLALRGRRFAKLIGLDLSKGELFLIYIATGYIFALIGTYMLFMVISVPARASYELFNDPISYSFVGDKISGLWRPMNKEAVNNLFMGGASVPWSVWIIPIISWTLFFGALIFLLFAVGSVLYRRWGVAEKLAFPLVTPVLSITDTMAGSDSSQCTLKNRIFLIGIILPVVIKVFSLLHQFFPMVPTIPMGIDLGPLFGEGVLGQAMMAWPGTWVRINLDWLGIAYLVPSDLAFSLGFFYYIFQRIGVNSVLVSAGIMPSWQLHEYQFVGGSIALVLFLVWMGRGYFREVIIASLGKCKFDEHDMPMSPKVIVFGSLISIAFLLIAGTVLLDIAIPFMIFNIVLMLSFAVSHARFRAEGGYPLSTILLNTPDRWVNWFGSEMIQSSRAGLRIISQWTAWTYTTSTAWIMEGFKLADESGVKRRVVFKVFILSVFLIFIIGSPIILKAFYTHGLGRNIGGYTGVAVPNAVLNPSYLEMTVSPMDYALFFTVFGIVITGVLSYLRATYYWWPFHPVGYLLAQQIDTGFRIPGPFLIGWIIKTLVFRYGGGGAYEKLKPMFVGLIIGWVGMDIVNVVIQSAVQMFS